MQDLIGGVNADILKLNETIKDRYHASVAYDKAENAYRKALGKAMAEAKANGMAATALYEYCRGLEQIADFRFMRDLEKSKVDMLTEQINYYKLAIRIASGQIDAERRGM